VPEPRAFWAGGLLRLNVDAARTNLDKGLRVRPQVQVPGRGTSRAAVGSHDHEPGAVCEVLDGRRPSHAGAPADGPQQQNRMSTIAAE
jgi:hypothetical protein